MSSISLGEQNYKWGRTYNLVVDLYTITSTNPFKKKKVETIEIPYPITLQFNVSRGMDKKINSASFKLLNLSERTRAFLYKDQFDDKYLEIKLYAGYSAQIAKGSNPPLIFDGTIKDCYSYKATGSTEWTTEIEAWDGGMTYAIPRVAFGFQKSKKREIIEKIVAKMPDVKIGNITPTIDQDKLSSKIQFKGNPFDLIKSLAGEKRNVFVDNGKLNITDDETCLNGLVSEISIDSGLLGTPKRKSALLTAEMLFEPNLIVGQYIFLKSETCPYLNGSYKIINFTHEGQISGAVCGQCTTTVDLYLGTMPFKLFSGNGKSLWSV